MGQSDETSIHIQPGSLLVASSRLLDPNFRRTVVLILEHTPDGTIGLILNRSSEINIQQIWSEVSDTPCELEQPLQVGGPVEGPLTVLHAHEPLSERAILAGVHFSAEKERIEELVNQNHRPARFFMGYSGWAPGQLEGEIECGSWLLTPGRHEHIFPGQEDLWERVTQEIAASVLPRELGSGATPHDPSMN